MRSVLMLSAAAFMFATGASATEKAGYDGGAYAGVAIGYSAAVLTAEDVDLGAAGANVGAYLGFGGVVDGVYVGVEGDGSLIDLKGSLSDGEVTAKAESGWRA